MTDPTTRQEATFLAGQQAAQDMGQSAFGTPGEAAQTDEQVAASIPGGVGVTEADLEAVKALVAQQVAALQSQLTQALAGQAAARGENPVHHLVHRLAMNLGVHNDPKAVSLGDDAKDALANALDAGSDMSALGRITDRISKHLARNRPHPGENFHYQQARQIADELLPDAI